MRICLFINSAISHTNAQPSCMLVIFHQTDAWIRDNIPRLCDFHRNATLIALLIVHPLNFLYFRFCIGFTSSKYAWIPVKFNSVHTYTPLRLSSLHVASMIMLMQNIHAHPHPNPWNGNAGKKFHIVNNFMIICYAVFTLLISHTQTKASHTH